VLFEAAINIDFCGFGFRQRPVPEHFGNALDCPIPPFVSMQSHVTPA
jgi:hypothetical protein